MRPFRGKDTNGGGWAEGDCFRIKERYFIVDKQAKFAVIQTMISSNVNGFNLYNFIEVLPASVGQQIGAKTKTGKEIYGGDIVEIISPKCLRQRYKFIGVVEYEWAAYRVRITDVPVWEGHTKGVTPPEHVWVSWVQDSALLKVIGNLTDNKNLLKGTT